eukprot:TRINITY_DN20229_c0_g8_i1.p1 TRINITY_DN20229_c0_g8~~TRINITY_DN20229_c0_g8_i1.p1  ORF type:complete len:422 (-),score=38.79 TRINITY_DN20229_c0_g8_i1:261-1451(-)
MMRRRTGVAKLYPEFFGELYTDATAEPWNTKERLTSPKEKISRRASSNLWCKEQSGDSGSPKAMRDTSKRSTMSGTLLTNLAGEPSSPKTPKEQGSRYSLMKTTSMPSFTQNSSTVKRFSTSQTDRFSASQTDLARRSNHKAMTLPNMPRPSSSEQASQDARPAAVNAERRAAVTQRQPEPAKPSHSVDLVWVARHHNVPLDNAKQAAELFLKEASSLDKALNLEQFGRILLLVTGKQSLVDLPQGLLDHSFRVADTDKGGDICFSEFVAWYASVGFNTNVTLSETERDIREFCEKHDMGLVEVDSYKKYFQEFDSSGRGELDQKDFERLILKCARVPHGVEVPAARMRQLWNEADIDGGGTIDFYEFAIFYKKHFADQSGFFDFYQKVRPALGSQ